MKRKELAILIVAIIAFWSVVVIVVDWTSKPQPPHPDKHPPMIFPDFSPRFSTVVQGATFQVNLTITSYLDSEIFIPIENLSIEFYNNSYRIPFSQERIFNYTFSSNPLNLAPLGDNSSIITMQLAEDALTGDYVMYVNLGNTQLTAVAGNSFSIEVTSSKKTGTS
jgi:hypothetical protein